MNANLHMQVWNNCLQMIQGVINPNQYKTWFEPIKPVSLSGNVFTIEVPSSPQMCAMMGFISGIRHGQLIMGRGCSKEPAGIRLPPDPAGVPWQNFYQTLSKGLRRTYWK